jgi:UDP-N-acetylmuramoyl-tripeptide--D-alanyl-D-alanine ligase
MMAVGKQIASRVLPFQSIAEARSLDAWRAKLRRLIRPAARLALQVLTPLYRTLLRRVIFIGVTGSCGKTTAKELLHAVLATQYQGRKSVGNYNRPPSLARTILRVRPWHKFCVLEIAICTREGLIPLEVPVRLARPKIGIVTAVGKEHLSAFKTIEAIAAEKAKLVAALPPNGTAVLNVDDPHVRAMRTLHDGPVITYGMASDAMVRAENIRADWPQRLSFTVHYQRESHEVGTQLCGEHLLPSVLAALAGAIAMGVPLATAVRAVGQVPPFEGRMSPVTRPDGVTFIVDDAKAPLWSIPATLQFMRRAQASRKIVVIGTISDYGSSPDRTYISTAREALEVADEVVFVGNRSSKCLKAKRHKNDHALQAFYSKDAACDYLHNRLRPGDLVLIKASESDLLRTIVEESPQPSTSVSTGAATAQQPTGAPRPQVVVGLGNPGAKYAWTPHNIGHRALDSLAQAVGQNWIDHKHAMVARLNQDGRNILLVKLQAKVNTSGSALAQLCQQLGFGPAECILVHDDLDLSLGIVRVRPRGGDGGHRGVRSILEAFRTDEVRRVKIGVGRPGHNNQASAFVLTETMSVSPGAR